MAPVAERKNYKNVFDVSRCHFVPIPTTSQSSDALFSHNPGVLILSYRCRKALTRTASEEGTGALYKGLLPNVLRGMAMNVGMLACYDQAKESVAKILNDPMTNGPALTTQIGASCVAVSRIFASLIRLLSSFYFLVFHH